MPTPQDRPFRTTGTSDGEQASPLPPVYPPQRLPNPSNVTNGDGNDHSATIKWPPAQDDPTKPFKSLR